MYTVKIVTELTTVNNPVTNVSITFKCKTLKMVNEVLKRFKYDTIKVDEFMFKKVHKTQKVKTITKSVFETHTAIVERDEKYGKSVNIAPTGRGAAVLDAQISRIASLSFED